jgi:phosphoenolpyruvate phosphomutase/phosphonopyruvate hydrolase
VVVPTALPDLTEARFVQLGKIGMVIYGNHAVRAAVTAMRQIFAEIRADGGIHSGIDSASSRSKRFSSCSGWRP